MASSDSPYTSGDIRPLLDRSLRRFRTIASLLNLGRRIFQKVHQLAYYKCFASIQMK